MALKLKVTLTEEQKKLFRETAADLNETIHEGTRGNQARWEWAAQFGDMLMKTLPVTGTIRSIFDVRDATNKPDGKFLIDVNDVVAWEAPTFGSFARNYIEGDEVYVKWTAFATTCYYPLTYARDADYDVANFALQKMNDALLRAEEEHGWFLIRAAANNSGNEQKIQIPDAQAGCGKFSKELFNAAAMYFEATGKTLDSIYMPPDGMGDIRMWTSPEVDPTTQRQILVQAGLNTLWNIELDAVPLIVYYKSVEDRKSRSKSILDRLFNPNDKFMDGSPVWSGAAKSLYAQGKLKLAYGISKANFGIYAIRERVKTVNDPSAIKDWMQGIIARFESGFVIVDGENIVRLVVDRTATPPAA